MNGLDFTTTLLVDQPPREAWQAITHPREGWAEDAARVSQELPTKELQCFRKIR